MEYFLGSFYPLSTCFVCGSFCYSYYVLCTGLFYKKCLSCFVSRFCFASLCVIVVCFLSLHFRRGNFIGFYPLSQMFSFARGWFEFCYAFVALLGFRMLCFFLYCYCSLTSGRGKHFITLRNRAHFDNLFLQKNGQGISNQYETRCLAHHLSSPLV